MKGYYISNIINKKEMKKEEKDDNLKYLQITKILIYFLYFSI